MRQPTPNRRARRARTAKTAKRLGAAAIATAAAAFAGQPATSHLLHVPPPKKIERPGLWVPQAPAILKSVFITGGVAHAPMRNKWAKASALYIVKKLGLAERALAILDAGDASSLSAGADKWLDLGPNGYDFYLGSGTGADAADPTINGTAGALDSGCYLSSDGADYLTYDSANETWMKAMHKDNAKIAWLCWTYPVGGTVDGIFGTRGPASGGNIGFEVHFAGASPTIGVTQRNGTTVQTLISTTATASTNTWHLISGYVDEAAGGSASFVGIDQTFETFDGTYTSPSASDPTFTMGLMQLGGAGSPHDNGGRAAIYVFLSSLNQQEALAFYQATRGRFGV